MVLTTRCPFYTENELFDFPQSPPLCIILRWACVSHFMTAFVTQGIQDGLYVPCHKYTMLLCLPSKLSGLKQMFRLDFLNECIKNLKNGTCHFQILHVWFFRNEREKMNLVKQKWREKCVCEVQHQYKYKGSMDMYI